MCAEWIEVNQRRKHARSLLKDSGMPSSNSMSQAVISMGKRLGHAATHVIYSNLLQHRSFTFDGLQYRYFYHRYNSTCETERCIEIPIALNFLHRQPVGATLEIGNVLNHYTPFQHTVVDKYETGNGVINVDVCDFEPASKYAVIISISTLEHVGWDEESFDPGKALYAIVRLRHMLNDHGRMLVSFPLGHHAGLDRAICNGDLGCYELRGMKRFGNIWTEVSVQELLACKLEPPYRRGNGAYRRVRGVAFASFRS
jgi:hypothetical protein